MARAATLLASKAHASKRRASKDRRYGKRRPSELPVTARNIAAQVIARVEKDDAFAAAVLDHELRRATQLSSRDRALATELVYGTLRLRTLLERTVEAATPRGIQALDPRTRAMLLIAAYQIHYTRIPAFAAVSEAVEAIGMLRGRALSGFANGALRQVAARAVETPLPPLPGAFREATAPWLRRALERSIGDDATDALLTAGPIPPPNGLRVRMSSRPAADAPTSIEELRKEWVETLAAAAPNATVALGQSSPAAISMRGGGDLRELPGFREGAWTIQEEGSQLVGLLLGARPGDRLLDACAGRGNKASLLLDALMVPREDGAATIEGRLDVVDLHPEKLERLGAEMKRLRLPKPRSFAVDWTIGRGDVEADAYDRVLVDAPCSGTGTLRRRPEIQTRRKAADLTAITDMQVAIVCNAASVVRPGGRLVYAICSVLRDEAESVVARILEHRKDLEVVPFDAPIAESLFGPGADHGRLLTNIHGTDAYFIASFRRRVAETG